MTTAVATQELIQIPRKPRSGGLGKLWDLAKRNPVGAAAGVVCVLLVLIAIFAPVLAPHPAEKVGFPRLHAPSAAYPFGTDNLFRDMYSRIIVGSRISLGIGFASVALGTLIGVSLGLLSGYIGGWADLGINRGMDTVMAFPPLVLAIFFLSIFRPSFFTVSLAIAIIITPATARIVRGSVLSIRNQQYVEAANALGSSHMRIMVRHILPNVAAPIIVIASIQIGNAILAEAALSFLSLGTATDANPSWGKMLQDTRSVWQSAWWTSVIPGAAISVAVLAFNLFGDALRDILDPRLRGS